MAQTYHRTVRGLITKDGAAGGGAGDPLPFGFVTTRTPDIEDISSPTTDADGDTAILCLLSSLALPAGSA